LPVLRSRASRSSGLLKALKPGLRSRASERTLSALGCSILQRPRDELWSLLRESNGEGNEVPADFKKTHRHSLLAYADKSYFASYLAAARRTSRAPPRPPLPPPSLVAAAAAAAAVLLVSFSFPLFSLPFSLSFFSLAACDLPADSARARCRRFECSMSFRRDPIRASDTRTRSPRPGDPIAGAPGGGGGREGPERRVSSTR